MDTRSSRPAAPSLAALLGGIMHDAKDLLVQELRLAKLEGHDELRQIKTAVILDTRHDVTSDSGRYRVDPVPGMPVRNNVPYAA